MRKIMNHFVLHCICEKNNTMLQKKNFFALGFRQKSSDEFGPLLPRCECESSASKGQGRLVVRAKSNTVMNYLSSEYCKN